jgi:hypothetical protein
MSASWQNKYLVPKRKRFPESCDHTSHPTDQHGKPAGSWFNTVAGDRIRVACYYCNKLYGYIPTPEEREGNERRRSARERK